MLFLSDREIIEISEFETLEQIKNFLQSIITNDINLINSENNSIYTLFLNSSGRFLFDCFLIIPFESSEIFLDCNKNFTEKIILHIKKYKLRLNFQIKKREDLIVISGNSDNFNEKIICSFLDNRGEINHFQKRFIICKSFLEKIKENNEEYEKERLLSGILDGAIDLESESSLPINFNMHNQNAISLSKGCYIGQETTNRLFRTSILKKSLFLIEILDCKKICLKKNDDIFYQSQNGENHKIGSLVSFYENIGLALCFFEKPEFIENQKKKEFLNEIFLNDTEKIFPLLINSLDSLKEIYIKIMIKIS